MLFYITNPLNLSFSNNSRAVEIQGKGPFSIQPELLETVTGNPTYTLEVSNDYEDEPTNFIQYSESTTGLPVTKGIEIRLNSFPWKYLRIAIAASTGDLGSARFNFIENE